MILALRTDRPIAELYLMGSDGGVVASHSWQADRQLTGTLLGNIQSFAVEHKISLQDLTAVAVFSGTGSFTGLRIGSSVANALAYSLGIKVAKVGGDDWLEQVPAAIAEARLGEYPAPDYDRAANITN